MKTNKKSYKKTVIISLFSLLLVSGALGYVYQKLSTYEKGILPPFAAHDIEFLEYEINADSVSFVHTENGTHLEIAPNSFVDSEGKTVTGKLKMKVREFHNAFDILKSGIPMNANEDRSKFLQSAGMVEVLAEAGGKSVKLKSGKTIKVELAGFRPSEGYDLYFLRNNESWANVGNITEGVNIRKEEDLAGLPLLPKKPKNPEPDSSSIVFELISDYNKYPYLIPFESQKWMMINDDETAQFPWGFRVNWDHVDIKPINKRKMEFELTFSRNYQTYKNTTKKEVFTIKATPVLKGEKLKEAKKEFFANLDKYNEVSDFLAQEQDRLAREADLVNKFSMDRLGIWNCDKLMDQSILAEIDASFDFEDEINPYFNEVKLYAVLEEENSVIMYLPIDWGKMKVAVGTKTTFIAMLPNNEVAVVKSDQFISKVKKYTGKVYFTTERIQVEQFFSESTTFQMASL